MMVNGKKGWIFRAKVSVLKR